MAADETFSSARALQEATAKDVQQRIATAHLRPMPSHAAPARPQAIRTAPGETSTLMCKWHNKWQYDVPTVQQFVDTSDDAQPVLHPRSICNLHCLGANEPVHVMGGFAEADCLEVLASEMGRGEV